MTAYTEVHEEELRRDDSAAAFQAYGILLFAFTVAPIIAGADKFFGILTNWTQYLRRCFPTRWASIRRRS
jgi:hypothetical protein